MPENPVLDAAADAIAGAGSAAAAGIAAAHFDDPLSDAY